MEFHLLGPLEVADGERMLSIGGPKQRTVLAQLLLQANRAVSVERLIDALWGEEPPVAARNTIQTYIRHLRKAVGPERIEHRSSGYLLVADPAEVDLLRFEALLEESRRSAASDPAAAVEALGEALRLWRGPALDDLSDRPSLAPEIARLEELRVAAVEERIAAELDLGRHAELVSELETLVGAHPLREHLWAHLMVALYRAGRQGDALTAYQRARELLLDELGIDPSPELQRLQEQILRQDAALEVSGEPLRGYRLLEELGAGAFGVVHRAFQPQVGREVAVKVIHSRFADDPSFIRRFEAEAQLVARLEHPHIVPLYDFWREPDGAYLVMRYLRGGSLRERLTQGPLSPEDAAELFDQVALGLSTAHRHGVVHRDLKPANVLFDEEGNAYLSDFGVARDLAAAEVTAGATSSPLAYYLSPEEIRREKVSSATDVYGLGVLLFEVLAGRHPFADTPPDEVLERHLREPLPPLGSIRSGLPAGIEEVIERATAKDPAERYSDAPELAAALRNSLAPTARPVAVAAAEARNPYKGLRAFSEADAADFFGREDLVADLVTRLAEESEGSRFLAVVGPSGSGKSSVVRAGLIPALRKGALPGSEDWFVVDMIPGAHPFEELGSALTRVAVDPPPGLGERLEGDDAGLLRAAAEILPYDAELMVLIDQFEELFTLTGDEDIRARFLGLLHAAVTERESRVRVVVTLRADFYDRPLSYKEFGDLLAARTAALTPLSVEELERAVAGPAERVGMRLEPALVADVVAEVAAQPGALPLLQYALTELFDKRDKRKDSALTLDSYQKIGGVSGALAGRAEQLYDRLNEAGKDATRQLFLRLVTLGKEGSEDTRRRVLRAELASLEVEAEAMESAIDAFGARRLLSFDRDPVTRGPTVEVAHEALLREWARLRGWIEGAREDVRAHRRLATAAREWAESGRDASFLLRGAHLSRFEAWTTTSGLALTADERDYLEASLAQREAEREEEERRKAHERTLERRSLRRLRALVAVLTAAALVAAGLTGLAFNQRGRAEREARFSAARELAAAALANLDVDPERSILLALEAVETTREADGIVLREAEEALRRAVKTSRLVLTVPQGGSGLAVTSDGTRFVTAGSGEAGDAATVWGMETGEELLAVTTPDEGRLGGLAVGPDDRLIVTTHDDDTVRVWDAVTGEELDVLEGFDSSGVGGWFPTEPVFSPDGRRLATSGGWDRSVRIWDVAAGVEEMAVDVGHDDVSESAAFSPEGSHLATASVDGTSGIVDLATGEVIHILAGHEWQVRQVAFSPDGSRIATASVDATARIWEAESGEHLRSLFHPAGLSAVAFSPDGSRIATGADDGKARIWEAETGRELLTLPAHGADVANVAFTPDGDRLLTSGLDDTTRVWDLSAAGARDWLTVPGAEAIWTGVAFSPDGTRFAAPAEPSGVTVWDGQTGEEIITLTGYERKLSTVTFSPDGRRLVAGSASLEHLTPPVWDVESGELLHTLSDHDTGELVLGVAFSPDGRLIATAHGDDGAARLWDAHNGKLRDTIEPGDGYRFAVSFSPDGRLVATGAEFGDARLWDAETLEEVCVLRGHSGIATVIDVTFGPGGLLATASEDGTARLWDVDSCEELLVLRGHDAPIYQVAFSPDGSRIATGGDDGTARLWDAETGRELLALSGHDLLVFGVAFSPDGRLLATASPDGTVALHLLPIDEFVDVARERVTRGLTDEECRQYLHLEACPAA